MGGNAAPIVAGHSGPDGMNEVPPSKHGRFLLKANAEVSTLKRRRWRRRRRRSCSGGATVHGHWQQLGAIGRCCYPFSLSLSLSLSASSILAPPLDIITIMSMISSGF